MRAFVVTVWLLALGDVARADEPPAQPDAPLGPEAPPAPDVTPAVPPSEPTSPPATTSEPPAPAAPAPTNTPVQPERISSDPSPAPTVAVLAGVAGGLVMGAALLPAAPCLWCAPAGVLSVGAGSAGGALAARRILQHRAGRTVSVARALLVGLVPTLGCAAIAGLYQSASLALVAFSLLAFQILSPVQLVVYLVLWHLPRSENAFWHAAMALLALSAVPVLLAPLVSGAGWAWVASSDVATELVEDPAGASP
ncbi:MAG: hypothetical protein AB2A00_09940 [Myxococcota bacterium]